MYQNGFFPYGSSMLYSPASATGSAGLFSGLKNINIAGFLTGTQKTLAFVNQVIPVVQQAKPIFANAKTMFKVMNSMKDEPASKNVQTSQNTALPSETKESNSNNNQGPTFFL